jgi:type I restriction enzyme S subunit
MAIAGYLAYESYKESGVEWIGMVPSAWNVERGKWLFKKMDRPVRPNDDIVTCFRDGQVTLRNNRRTDGFTNALKEHGYQGIRKGDLVIHAMDAFAGAIGVSDSDGKSTPVYSACVPRNADTVDPYFYAYYMRHVALSGLLVSIAKGIRERSTDFRFNDFADLELAYPSLLEQRAISKFLDEKCEGIDEAVRIKEQEIDLLRERRQILIQEAVTRGLDPAAPMKDSGIDWIGRIPAHWDLRNFRYLINVLTDFTANGSFADLAKNVTYLDTPDFSRLIRLTDLRKNLDNDGVFLDKNSHGFLKKSELFGGEILMANVGAYAGYTCIMPFTDCVATLGPNMFLIRQSQEMLADYLVLLLNSSAYWGYLQSAAQASAQPKLNKENVRSIRILLPPAVDQHKIVAHIDEMSRKIDDCIAIKERQITALKEYKISLINSAVTGKIKVI